MTIATHIQPLPVRSQRMGAGLQVQGLRGQSARIDPFIALDHFHMTQPTFAPHPHAGFSAVTYIFEDSATGFRHRDSLGWDGPIHPGDLHWTQAGAGVMHEEYPLQPGELAHGLQIFVNLPAALKLSPPRALHLARAEMPRASGPGWRAVVPFGAILGMHSPIPLAVDASLAIVNLDAGACWLFDGQAGQAAGHVQPGFVLLVEGEAQLDGELFAAGHAFAFAEGFELQATRASRLALFAGQPLSEPVVQHGPFVMNTEGQIVEALRRYQQGDMGRLTSAVGV